MSTAIRHGATGVMLSGETASGTYPLETVQTMARIVKATEDGLMITTFARPAWLNSLHRAVAHAGVELAREAMLPIIVATEHGLRPTGVRLPPNIPVTAVSDRLRALREPACSRGRCRPFQGTRAGSKTMKEAVEQLVVQGRIKPGERVVSISGSPA